MPQRDPVNDAPLLLCMHRCVGFGRRPEGLAVVASAKGTGPGAYFADCTHLEAASIEAFAALRDELESHDAPPALVARAESARRDEIRHARMMAKLARRFGAAEGDWSVPPVVNRMADRSLDVRRGKAVRFHLARSQQRHLHRAARRGRRGLSDRPRPHHHG
jgi:hypothetical protein